MKYADKIGAHYTAVLGSNELEEGTVNVKNMKTGRITAIPVEELGEKFITLSLNDAVGEIGDTEDSAALINTLFGKKE